MKIVAMAMFLGEDKVPLRIGKKVAHIGTLFTEREDKVPLRIGKAISSAAPREGFDEDKVPLRIGKWDMDLSCSEVDVKIKFL